MKTTKIQWLQLNLKKGKWWIRINFHHDFQFPNGFSDFVHETMHGEITQYDQTLVKVIAERLIEFFIESIWCKLF